MLMRGRPVPEAAIGDRPCTGAVVPVGAVAHGSEVPPSDSRQRVRGGDVRSRTTTAIRTVRAAVIVAFSTVGAGCYRYTPIDTPAQPSLGADVRVLLTDAGALALAPLIGNRVALVDGRLVEIADTVVTVSVTGTTDRLGNETPWRGEQVAIPRPMVDGFQRRTLDHRKSYVVGGIAAGLVVVAGIGFSIAGDGGGARAGQGGTPK